MHNLSKEETRNLIEFIHESLSCDTRSAYRRLVMKLQQMIGGNCAMDLPGIEKERGWNRSQAVGKFTHSVDSRTEAILKYALPHLRRAFERVASDKSKKQKTALSRREKEVLQWMSEGKCTWDISRILRITERTVYYHSQNIMQKLDAASRSHAISIAFKRGIIGLH